MVYFEAIIFYEIISAIMKIKFVMILWLSLCSPSIWSQDEIGTKIPMVGDDAPGFIAESTTGVLNFPADYGSKWKILFSHPRDFTPVCSSEILELAHMQKEFDKLNVKLVILSTDTLYAHVIWERALEKVSYKGRSPVKLKFPMIDDNRLSVSRKYGMIHPNISTTKGVRGVFIIGPRNKIEAIFYYPMNIGRNMEEIKRIVIALQGATDGKNPYLTQVNSSAKATM